MFENIIEQGAVSQLQDDILNKRNAPSMLFYGPSESAKGSAALELARVLSCETDGSWKCTCSSCERHRYLQQTDLLALGKKAFSAEINACYSTLLHNPSVQSSKHIFYRSLRKLQLRFSPVLMEDDPKFSKISSVLQSFDENLNDLLRTDTDSLEKLCNSLIKDALYLENEGFGTTIPIGHIRRAAYWCRLAPNGKHKILIIENADNMRDEARNSLLKLLEEPPASVSIVLTAQRKEAIMPTILSRLRPYRFLKRSIEGEREVLRRVFQVSQEMQKPETGGSLISIYLDSFLPQNTEKLFSLAAWFIVSLARITALSTKRKTGNIPRFIALLGERYAPIAETSGFERSVKSAGIVKTIVTQSSNFENDTFSRFLNICLDLIGAAAREADEPQFNDIFKKYIGEAVTAVDVLNQNTTLALESLIYNLKTGMVSAA